LRVEFDKEIKLLLVPHYGPIRLIYGRKWIVHMIISHAHQFIFLKTQKCAGTSVELALSQLCGPDDVITRVTPGDEELRIGRKPQNYSIPHCYRPPLWRLWLALGMRPSRAGTSYYNHMGAAALRRAMDPALFDAYRKVTVVRNPWDREVSLYYWTYRDNPNPPDFERFVSRYRYRPERKTFEIYSISGRIVADVILRYERLQADFEEFVASLGVKDCPELPRAKGQHRKSANRDYRKMYNNRTRRIVERRYAREIEAFGYEF